MQRKKSITKWMAGLLSVLFVFGLMPVASAFSFFGKKEAPLPKPTPPDMKLYALCEPVSPVVTARTLRTKGTTFQEAQALYDGSEDTVFFTEQGCEVTLDLGRTMMLGGVNFLPAETEGSTPDRCLGTAFYLSNNNRTFRQAVTAEPLDHQGYTTEPKALMFGGAGESRYVKIVIPPKASIGEVRWLCYPEWQYTRAKGQTQWQIRLYHYEVQKDVTAKLVICIHNSQGVLKQLSVTEHTFFKDQDGSVDVQVPIPNHSVGDSYRILLLHKDGSSVLAQPLNYTYTNGSPQFSMSNLFSDAMMFQAQQPLTVWGNAPWGSQVELVLTNETETKTVTATANLHGAWEANLGSFPYGGNYTLTVANGKEKKQFQNLTFGDVWLCVGQSNMDYHLLGGKDTTRYLNSDQGKAETENPEIRLLNLWTKGTNGAGAAVKNLPIGYVNPAWSQMNHEAASYCSAIGYFFATQIQKEYQIPVGIINAAVGDTEINRWLPYGMKTKSFTSTDGGLYYNRVLPFAKLKIRGILMYQGEADEYRTHLSTAEYRDAMVGLVNLYRSIWGKDLPFYWTQMTRYKNDESLIREGQRLALDAIYEPKNAGVISLMDIYGAYEEGAGNCRSDIHPEQKQVVAERFVRYAKRDVYGAPNTVVSGPTLRSTKRVGTALELTFDTTGDLAVLPKERYADAKGMAWILENQKDETKLQAFEVAGRDGVFHEAEAQIQGNKVILTCDAVPEPIRARYAWGAYPEMPNLTDQSGLPALSFCS